MKQKSNQADPLKELLQQHGTIATSEGFSLRLMNVVITSYKFSYSKRYRKQERFGKWIIGVLISSSVLIFIELKPSIQVMEMVFPIIALAIGVAVLMLLLKKMAKFRS